MGDETQLNKKMAEERLASDRAVKRIVMEGKTNEAPDETLPPPIKSLKSTPMAETVKIWARQSKQFIVQICDVKGCYYPLSIVRDPKNNNDPLVVMEPDPDYEGEGEAPKIKVGVMGCCSWAGKAHGEQVIRPPLKEDEI